MYVAERNRVWLPGERFIKRFPITWRTLELLGHVGLRRGHLDRVEDWSTGLLFEVFRTAVPKLSFIEYRIENGRSIATAMLPTMAD